MQVGSSPIAPAGRALLFLLLSSALAAIPGELQAAIYRWVDAAGREHFTLDLEQVPPHHRAAAAAAEKRSRSRMNVVGGGSSSNAESPAAPGPARVGPTPRKLEAKKPGGHDEAWWRAEHQRHLSDVERARKAVERAEDITQYSSYHAGVSKRQRARARNDAKRARAVAVKRAQDRLQATQRALADFLEGARRAGVPPGWLR
jgi:hypothetical protein